MTEKDVNVNKVYNAVMHGRGGIVGGGVLDGMMIKNTKHCTCGSNLCETIEIRYSCSRYPISRNV